MFFFFGFLSESISIIFEHPFLLIEFSGEGSAFLRNIFVFSFKFFDCTLFFLDFFIIILFYFIVFLLEYLPVFEDDFEGFFELVVFLLFVSILLLEFFEFEV